MSFEKVFEVDSKNGNSYLLRISEYFYDRDFGVPIFHVNFALVTKISDDFDFKLLPNIAVLLAEIESIRKR